jgi:hypothetical protein
MAVKENGRRRVPGFVMVSEGLEMRSETLTLLKRG